MDERWYQPRFIDAWRWAIRNASDDMALIIRYHQDEKVLYCKAESKVSMWKHEELLGMTLTKETGSLVDVYMRVSNIKSQHVGYGRHKSPRCQTVLSTAVLALFVIESCLTTQSPVTQCSCTG